MDEQILFDLLRADLNRLGERPDDDYLKTLLRAARLDLERRGVHFPDDDQLCYTKLCMDQYSGKQWHYQ